MGTDIHMAVRHRLTGNGWEWSRIAGYGDRSYMLFAVLANVRNGYGFAGCETHNPLSPIATPRGLPRDLKASYRNHAELNSEISTLCLPDDRWYDDSDIDRDQQERIFEWFGDHSYSYVTLAEVLAYDWDQRIVLKGVVDAEQYEIFREKGKPEQWCGGVSGDKIFHVDEVEMQRRLAKNDWTLSAEEIAAKNLELLKYGRVYNAKYQSELKDFYTRIEWTETVRDQLSEGWWKFVEVLKRFCENQSITPDDVQLVFGFDS